MKIPFENKMTWVDKIGINNPEIPLNIFKTSNSWLRKLYENNPLELPPDNNPSQNDIDFVWVYVVNKKRGFVLDTHNNKFYKILKNNSRIVNHTIRSGFKFNVKI
jgi:hypothetical protein